MAPSADRQLDALLNQSPILANNINKFPDGGGTEFGFPARIDE
jgi:hypothetical protein